MAGYSTPAWTNGTTPAINASNLLAMGRGIEIAEHPYGVCATGASTVAKTVAIDYSSTLSLFTGLTVRVKFSSANTASNPTLNVNGTGAKAMMLFGSLRLTSWEAGAVITFTYDGTNWVVNNSIAGGTILLADYTLSAYNRDVTVTTSADISSFSRLLIFVYGAPHTGIGNADCNVYAGVDTSAPQLAYTKTGASGSWGAGGAEVMFATNSASKYEVYSISFNSVESVAYHYYSGTTKVEGTSLFFTCQPSGERFEASTNFKVYGIR